MTYVIINIIQNRGRLNDLFVGEKEIPLSETERRWYWFVFKQIVYKT